MKRTISIICASALFSIAFMACKKDYTCKCDVTLNVPGFGSVSADTSYTISKTTKKDAQNKCSDSDKELKAEAEPAGGSASCSL